MLCVGKSPRLGAYPKGLGPCDSQDKILGITIPLFFLSEGEERRGRKLGYPFCNKNCILGNETN
jgi:hypothetical protein